MTWDAFKRGSAGAAQGEEELRMLWRRYKEHKDPAARDRLILTFAPLVKYVAGRMNSHLPAHVVGEIVPRLRSASRSANWSR